MDGVISTASDFVVNIFCRCLCVEVHHICRLDKNLEALEKAMGRLQGSRNDVVNRVQRDEDTGLQRLDGVKVWLKDVETIENQADTIERNMACISELHLCSPCSNKLASRCRYGRKVFSMLEDVKALMIAGEFNAVAAPPVREVVEERDLQQTIVGQETILESAWNRLMDNGTKMMGLYGMGGVGKTTLLEQINNKFKVANDFGFEKVIWVVVSKDKLNEKIQDEIAEKLGIIAGVDSWKQKTETQKASDIRTSMKKKRFVLLLDDIWSKVELKGIGVPFATEENKCKIVFTTRSREVCERMGVNDPIEVTCLDTDKAWDLFKERVGENTLRSHPGIPELARKVAGKCRGLPLALNVLGETMSFQKTIQEWRHAVKTLTKFSGMDDEILRILKYSYDSLKEKDVKPCFLYCSLFPEDFEIRKDMLIEYWICEGFIQEKQSREEAFDQGYGILSGLVRVCLLVEVSIDKVKMHDVVREMALWVANDLGEHKERCIVQAGVGLREVPTVENWGIVRKMSLMYNEIENISDSPDCPELTTLLFQKNDMGNISGEFFKSMPKLVVLDLSHNRNFINGLPEEISKLVSLRYLDLSNTGGINRLHASLQELKKLVFLNLESTALESISGISKLSSLRTLRLVRSKMSQDLNVMKELEFLEHLEVVTIDIGSALVADQLLNATATRVVNAIQEIYINDLKGKDSVLTFPYMAVLRTLQMYKSEMVEINIERRTSWRNKIPTTSGFPNLSRVSLSYCHGLKDLTWLLYAPNLVSLTVGISTQIEDIISKEKAVNIFTEEEARTIIPFRRLEQFQVYNLPKLKSIYWSALPFPCLRKFHIGRCPNLRKLPLDSKSGEDLVIHNGEQYWMDKVEWEDEATKERFLRSLQPAE